jgi:hypothetical protein
MRQLSQLLSWLRSARASTRAVGRRPVVETLEDRTVPSTVSSITSNFNGTAIPAGDTVWFSSVGKVQGVGSTPVTLHITAQTISFSVAGAPVTVSVPDATVIISPAVTSATTTFDATTNTWVTTEPPNLSGNTFLGGVAFTVTQGLPGGINPVTWQASFSTDTPGISVNWQWAAAVYRQFGTDYGALGVKPVDANNVSAYLNSDHAGTPESFKTYVTGGARGGGGSNFTGSYSATGHVTPAVVMAQQLASLSGTVFADTNFDGVQDNGETGLGGVTIFLEDTSGNVLGQTQTDGNGHYSFTGLAPGSYVLVESPVPGYGHGQDAAGTVNGVTVGSAPGGGEIDGITLNGGDAGINYNFAELPGIG